MTEKKKKMKTDQETLAFYPRRSKNYSEFVGQSNSSLYYLIFRKLSRKEAGHTMLSRGEKYLITALAMSAESSKL